MGHQYEPDPHEMVERKTWSCDTFAGIHRLYEALLRKGRRPSEPRWCSFANAWVVTGIARQADVGS